MKKLLLLFCISLLHFASNAQNINRARHQYMDNCSNMVSLHSKSYYVEYSYGASTSLVCINGSGQTIFRTPLLINFWSTEGIRLIKTLDKNLALLVRQQTNCDIVTDSTFLLKCDTNGLLIYKKRLSSNMSPALITEFTQHSDSSFYFSCNNGPIIHHYSKLGIAMGSMTTVFSQIYSIATLQNGNLLVNGLENNIIKNMELTTANTVVNQQATTYKATGFTQGSNGLLYGIEGGALHTYSSNLLPVNNSTIATGSGIRITDFKLRNDSVFCVGQNQTNMLYYAILSPGLTMLYQTQSSYKGITPTGITLNNLNQVSIINKCVSNDNQRLSFSSLYQTSITGSLVSTKNIGVVGISILSANVSNPGPVNFTGLKPLHLNLEVQVKNFGTDTVRYFYLNHDDGAACPSTLHKLFRQDIYPNSIVTVTTGAFNSSVPLPYNNPVTDLQICVNTSVPDSSNDINIDNDSWCASLSVRIDVGIDEKVYDQVSAKLFPNPSQNQFSVEAEQRIKRIDVSTTSGTIVYVDSTEGNSINISTADWPAGIYFVTIHTSKGRTTKKMIKN